MPGASLDSQTAADFLSECAHRTERLLEAELRTRRNDARLLDAIRYACLSPGKRIRPALIYASAKTLNLDPRDVDHIVCAIELLHSYSLIHDDLPAVDNDDYRRGQLTCHKRFGEATAILAGDAMQAMAYEVLSRDPGSDPRQTATHVSILARYTGTEGMSGGQALDVAPRTCALKPEEVEQIHRLKTGMLILAAIEMTLICSPGTPSGVRTALENYARLIGLVFQIRDDLLDEREDQSTTTSYPASYPAVMGVEKTRQILDELHQECLIYLDEMDGDTRLLVELTNHIATRYE